MTESEKLRAIQLAARAIYNLKELDASHRAWLLQNLKNSR